jgi:hypothetical protein
MGLLVAARKVSGREWAASTAAVVAVLTAIALEGPPRFTTLAFLLPGLVIDAFGLLLPRWERFAVFAGVVAGLANVVKFAVGFAGIVVIAHTNTAYTAALTPWISHFVFGFCGGLVAALLCRQGSANG